MNAHTPFDAKQDWTNPYCQNSSNDPMVDALLGNAYHVVRTVYCNLGNLKLIYDFLNQYGMVLGVQSEAELKALTTEAKYARIYGFSRAGDRKVTDYLYVEGDRTGILPNDATATGSWITVATSGSSGGGGGTSSGESAYIPWVYNNGSATGGETSINVPDDTVGVPFIIINGDVQYVGRGFEFNVDNLSVTLAQPLEEGDEVVFLLTGTPAVPDNPNVNDWIQINWLYNKGAAVGGEQVIAIPYTFQSIPAVYKNGLRLYKGLTTESYTADPDNQRIFLTEPLATNDRLIVQIGGEAQVLEVVDHTLQEVARATNVKDSEVILSTDTTQFLNGKKIVYSVNEQKVYSLPALPTNVFIESVGNGKLVYSPGSIEVDLLPIPGSEEILRADLSSSAPGKGVSLVTGAATQSQVDALQARSDSFAYIEDYSNLVVDNDWSDAIQAAFDTGKVVVGESGKPYKITKIINTQGQQFLGNLTLDLQRITIPAAVVTATYEPPKSDTFRGIYVGTAYDFCEMLRIKSLGFNTVIHYCYFDNNGDVDINGTMQKLLLNCKSAGLNVVINTNIEASHGQGTVAQIVSRCDSYSNCIGYSVVDEPASRGISVAEQDNLIDALRALTNKKLYAVDYMWVNNPWEYKFSRKYDVFLVNSYSMYYATGTLQERIDKDLGKMRTDLGGCMVVTGSARIIPVVQTYTQYESNPVEGVHGSYCFDVDQIVGAAKVFGKTGNGDFAAFCWDNGFTTTMAKEPKYQALVKELINHADKGEVYRTEPIVFGGVGGVDGRLQYPLGCLTSIQQFKDPTNSVDAWLGGGSAPVRVMTGASETPLRTTVGGVDISGIGFNTNFSRFVTNKSLLKYFTGFFVFENVGAPLTQPATFEIYSTPDGGYTETLRYSSGVTAGSSHRFSGLMTANYDGIGENAVFSLNVENADAIANYRRIIYGLFISTNW